MSTRWCLMAEQINPYLHLDQACQAGICAACSWEQDQRPPVAFIGDHVRVEESDAIDGALVLSIATPAHDPEVGLTVLEISRAEAREIIQGLAALL